MWIGEVEEEVRGIEEEVVRPKKKLRVCGGGFGSRIEAAGGSRWRSRRRLWRSRRKKF